MILYASKITLVCTSSQAQRIATDVGANANELWISDYMSNDIYMESESERESEREDAEKISDFVSKKKIQKKLLLHILQWEFDFEFALIKFFANSALQVRVELQHCTKHKKKIKAFKSATTTKIKFVVWCFFTHLLCDSWIYSPML